MLRGLLHEFDREFENTSYIDRFTILGKRLLRKRIYQAVWVAVVDLKANVIEEPDPLMTYDKFVAHLKGWIDVARASFGLLRSRGSLDIRRIMCNIATREAKQ